MKRFLSISLVCTAVALMLSVSFIPHHHHGEVVCADVHTVCGNEGSDAHRGHGEEAPADSGGCLADIPYLPRCERQDEHTCCGAPAYDDDGHTHLFFILLAHNAELPADGTAVEYGGYIILHHSSDVRTGVGLRAPPAILC